MGDDARRKTAGRASRLVRLTLLGSSAFLAGCARQPDPAEEWSAEDGVPVSAEQRPNTHYSSHYGGFVPLFIPMGGLGRGRTYQQHYQQQPESVRRAHAAPGTFGVSGRTSGTSTRGGGASAPGGGTVRGGFGSRGGFSASS